MISFKNACVEFLNKEDLGRVPDVVTLNGFNDWIQKHLGGKVLLSSHKSGSTGCFPSSGDHIIYDVPHRVHHDYVKVHVDGTIEFHPTNPNISTSPIGRDHVYVRHCFDRRCGHRTVSSNHRFSGGRRRGKKKRKRSP
jgi:hypothetical protein